MGQDEWELEMNRMLDSFANQALSSLEKIDQRFAVLGRSVDEEFCQYFIKMLKLRLDMTFNKYLYSKRQALRKPTENRTNTFSPSGEGFANPLKNENLDDGGLIEIFDSDDDDNYLDTKPAIDLRDEHVGGSKIHRHSTDGTHSDTIADHENGYKPPVEAESKVTQEDGAMVEICDSDDGGPMVTNANNGSLGNIQHQSLNDAQNDIPNIDGGNEVKLFVKDESSAASENELYDIPVIEFDANEGNGRAIEVSNKNQNCKSHSAGPSSKAKSNPSKRNAGNNRFKCKHCDCTFKYKHYLKQHQPIHANGKFIGVKADSNGLYRCNLCVRRFIDIGHLSAHMKSHENGQQLYYCSCCMRKFVEEAKKDRHESQCKGHHFECHLCKVYVTRIKAQMHRHMRTHSGVKPFSCMVCNNSFQQKFDLRYHLNTIHSRSRS